MDIGATNASEVHLQKDIVRVREFRHRAVFEKNVLDSTKDEGVVLLLRVSRIVVGLM
jgi:hypothetical protein